MTGESEAMIALKRAGTRAVFHLLRAGVESLKAVEAIIEELGKVGRQGDRPPEDRPVRIDIE